MNRADRQFGRTPAAERLAAPPSVRRAFSLVELLVVISIIILVLAVSLPGLSAMSADTRQNAAIQQVNSVLSRAYYLAVQKGTITAVRFMPSEWDAGTTAAPVTAGRQRLVIYQYVGVTDKLEAGLPKVEFNEYFRRAEGTDAVELPSDVWVAPLEALASAPTAGTPTIRYLYDPNATVRTAAVDDGMGLGFLLLGPLWNAAGDFPLSPISGQPTSIASSNVRFASLDDFLIVFDPKEGLIGGVPSGWRVLGFNPQVHEEQYIEENGDENFQRFNYTGLVVYRREVFLTAGDTPTERQQVLRDNGQTFLVNRFGGGLVAAGAAR